MTSLFTSKICFLGEQTYKEGDLEWRNMPLTQNWLVGPLGAKIVNYF
jgi:hypothetical protein